MTPAGHARRRLQRLALALASLALAIGVAELAMRVLAPPWLRARMREVAAARSLTDWGSDADWPVESDRGEPVRFVPGSAFDVRDDEYAHSVKIDEYGGRASGRAPAGTPPIVPVFGDSMTFGLGVRDEETWVSLAGRSLPVRLENFGMPGSEMIEDLHAIDVLDARLGAPRVCVFVVFLGNDLTQIAPTPAPGAGGSSPLSSWLSAANEALDQRSILRQWYVVQWTRALAVRAVNASRHEPQVQGMLALMDRATVIEPLRRAFEQAADRLVSTAALTLTERAHVLTPWSNPIVGQLAALLSLTGATSRADALIEQLATGNAYGARTGLALCYAMCGEFDRAAEWAERAIEERYPPLVKILAPLLRSTPKWPALAKLMNLP